MKLRRPLAWGAVFFITGITLGVKVLAPARPDVFWMLAPAVLGLALAAGAIFLCTGWARGALALISALAVGIAAGASRGVMPEPVPETAGTLTGVVCEISDREADWPALVLRDAVLEGVPLSFRVRVWVEGPQPDLRLGDGVSMEATLSTPLGQRNPGGYDAQSALWRQGIGLTGFGRDLARAGSTPLTLAEIALNTRAVLEGAITDALPGWEGGVMRALLLGVRDGLPDELTEHFQRVGVTHILALSGLHIAYLIMGLSLLLSFLGKRRAAALSIIAVWGYTWIVGFMPSIVRAAVMTTVAQCATLVGRRSDGPTSMAISALVILALEPLQLFSASFQLSFCAVGGIFLFEPPLSRWMRTVKTPRLISSTLAVSVGAQLGTLPATVYHFNQIPLVSLAANLPIIPISGAALISGAVMMLASLLGLDPLTAPLAWLTAGLVRAMAWTAEILAGIPGTLLRVATPSLVTLALGYALLITLGLWMLRRVKLRPASILCAVLSVMLAISCGVDAAMRAPKGLEFSFVDVGQGDGLVLRAGDVVAVVDTGTPGNTVARYLQHLGARVDAVFVTHPHDDHAGGLEAILRAVPVLNIVIGESSLTAVGDEGYEQAMALAHSMGVPVITARQGDAFTLGADGRIDVLWPPEGPPSSDANRDSLILQISYGGSSALITGDITSYVERRLTAVPDVDMLKVAHHGSRYSSTEPFLAAALPELSVISVGRNGYGHPSPYTLERLEAIEAQILRTDESGMVRVNFLPDGSSAYRVFLPAEERSRVYEVTK